MKTIKAAALLVAPIVAACGAPSTAAIDLGDLQQAQTKEANFGVRSDNGYECNSAHTGTCYYSEPGTWRVWINPVGLTSAELLFVRGQLGNVISTLNAKQFGSSNWGLQDFKGMTFAETLDYSAAHIRIQVGATGCASGPCMQGIQAYVSTSCASWDGALTETPVSLPGTHRHCNAWNATLDLDDILGPNWPSNLRDDLARFAFASVLLRSEGIGMTDSSSAWNGTHVNAVLTNDLISIAPVSNHARCRHHYASEGGSTICLETSCNFGLNSCN